MLLKDQDTQNSIRDEQVTVSFKCSSQQKANLMQQSVTEGYLSLSDYLKSKVFTEMPGDLPHVIDVIPCEERVTYESRIAQLSKEISDLRNDTNEIATLPSPEKNTEIENEDFVKEYLEWSESPQGLEYLKYKGFWGMGGLDLTDVTRKVVLNATLEMAINYIMPSKPNYVHEIYIKKHLAIEKARKAGAAIDITAIMAEGESRNRRKLRSSNGK